MVKKWAALQNAPFSAGLGGEEEAALRLGSNDLEALMMMGEDMRTCMSIGLPFSNLNMYWLYRVAFFFYC